MWIIWWIIFRCVLVPLLEAAYAAGWPPRNPWETTRVQLWKQLWLSNLTWTLCAPCAARRFSPSRSLSRKSGSRNSAGQSALRSTLPAPLAMLQAILECYEVDWCFNEFLNHRLGFRVVFYINSDFRHHLSIAPRSSKCGIAPETSGVYNSLASLKRFLIGIRSSKLFPNHCILQ